LLEGDGLGQSQQLEQHRPVQGREPSLFRIREPLRGQAEVGQQRDRLAAAQQLLLEGLPCDGQGGRSAVAGPHHRQRLAQDCALFLGRLRDHERANKRHRLRVLERVLFDTRHRGILIRTDKPAQRMSQGDADMARIHPLLHHRGEALCQG
jgi:hypothetical protein